MAQIVGPGEVVTFWLGQNDKVWFSANPAFDAEVLSRFAELSSGRSRAASITGPTTRRAPWRWSSCSTR
jgi:uncharacterized protein (DUF924 family)